MNVEDVTQYLRDRTVPAWRRYIGLFAAVYVASPLDFIPDWIPIIGWLDDIGVLAFCAWSFTRAVSEHAALRRANLPSDPRAS